MIIVHNISKEYSSTGWQQYEVMDPATAGGPYRYRCLPLLV